MNLSTNLLECCAMLLIHLCNVVNSFVQCFISIFPTCVFGRRIIMRMKWCNELHFSWMQTFELHKYLFWQYQWRILLSRPISNSCTLTSRNFPDMISPRSPNVLVSKVQCRQGFTYGDILFAISFLIQNSIRHLQSFPHMQSSHICTICASFLATSPTPLETK